MTYERVQKVIDFVLDNLFDIVTIGIAAYLIIRHGIQPFTSADISELAVWILAVLGLIAVSGLWDRHRRLRRIEKLMEESNALILRRISGKVYANDFFLSSKLTDEVFSSASKIFLAGITLTRTTREFMHILGQRLVAGANIRVIVIDRAVNSVMETMASRSMGDTTAEYWRTRMQTVESVIEAIAATPSATGKLEIGHLPYIPSFGLVFIDPDEPHAFCRVEIYHHRSAEPNPTFEIRASDDRSWYDFFRRQYEILWSSCRTEVLPHGKETRSQDK
jgi:hypothetical protein